ncbi:hypothetical protein PLICRDRAFT_155954 [Plicaturopsis crispa FD-325 SS-3]|nr:hypothetical protein PLICRDRAFT_155954 [Plicaturopsis crispa FD-325 SS-3]
MAHSPRTSSDQGAADNTFSSRAEGESYDKAGSSSSSSSLRERATKAESGGLPPGAMPPQGTIPSLPYGSAAQPATPNSRNYQTPPTSPNARLLDSPSAEHVQFASYPSQEAKEKPWNDIPPDNKHKIEKGWVPVPLRTWFWVTLVVFMVGGAIALEVALHFSNKNQGWPTGFFTSEQGWMHYVYTLPPVAVAMVIVALWTWTDIEIKKMQPYVDLVHGDSPPHRSLLLDYTRTSNFLVWTNATRNKHYLVALATLMVLVSLTFQPLAAAVFSVRDTYIPVPNVQVNNLQLIGLNQNAQFQDLTAFLSAAGYASASVLYDIGDPDFIHDTYTIGEFQLPTDVATNGTVFANTTAVKSEPGCEPADQTTMTQHADGQGWTNNATFNGCTFTWEVDKSTENLFGTSILNQCGNTITPDQFSPVVFWFFTYLPSASHSVAFCTPKISLFDVSVTVDLASGNLTSVNELRPFQVGSSNFSSLAGNVTGAPLNGRAYNGIGFNLTNPDRFTLNRENATQLQMPAAIFQAAESSPAGLAAAFTTNKFVQLSTQVYTTYLKLIARSVYFLPASEPMSVEVKTVRKRLWLSDVAVHLLVTAMLMLAFFGTILHLFHRTDRRDLVLNHQPGTIASAVSIGAQTNIGNILAGRQTTEDIIQALRDKKFRIDPHTMKIIMEGEEGYETAASPDPKRATFLGLLGLNPTSPGGSRRMSMPGSKRFSRQAPAGAV